MAHYVYILECVDGTYYTGYAKDPIKRYHQHTSGKGAKYTRSHPPKKMIYLEEFAEKGEALKREYAIKHLSRTQKEELIKKGSDALMNFTDQI